MFGSLFNNNKREISDEEKEDNKEINDYNKADIDNAMMSNIINNNMTDKLSFLEGTIYDCAKGLHFEWVEGYKIVDKNMCGINNYYSYGRATKFFDTLATNILVASKIILYEEIFTKDILDITKEIYPFVNSFEFDEETTYKNLIQNEIMKIYDNKDLIYLFKCVYKLANTASAKMDFYKIKMHTIVDDDNGKRFMNEFLTSCIREVRYY